MARPGGSDELQQLRQELEALREEQSIMRELFEPMLERWRALTQRSPTTSREPEPRAVRHPFKLAHPEWATYPGIRDNLRSLEQRAIDEGYRREEITVDLIAGMAGVSERTVRRRLRKDWGVDAKVDWPPSHLPDQPRRTPQQANLFTEGMGHVTSLIAAAAGVPVALDVFSDGKLDHAVHACRLAHEVVSRLS